VPSDRVATCHSGLPVTGHLLWTDDMTSPTTVAAARIRPIDDADRDGLTAFYAALSPDSLEARFHGAASGIGGRAARYLCGPDHDHREGLVAEVIDGSGRPIIIGHVCIEPTRAGEAEMAIAVADAWQRHGIGRRLLADSIVWASAHGFVQLVASVRLGNSAILGLIGSMDRSVTIGDCDGGVVDVMIDLRAPERVPDAA
jgi:acetyltransferase